MNKYTKKRRKKYYKQDKKKRTHNITKRASNFKINRKIEARFKNLDIKTINELRNKFEKEKALSKSKYIVNREQIGCSKNKNNMYGGGNYPVTLTDVLQKVEDFGTSTYNSVYGYPEVASQDPTDQPYLGNNFTV
jgi:hypothetical protein